MAWLSIEIFVVIVSISILFVFKDKNDFLTSLFMVSLTVSSMLFVLTGIIYITDGINSHHLESERNIIVLMKNGASTDEERYLIDKKIEEFNDVLTDYQNNMNSYWSNPLIDKNVLTIDRIPYSWEDGE